MTTNRTFDAHFSASSNRSLTELLAGWLQPLSLSWKRRLVLSAAAGPGRVLDLGCGTGELADCLARGGCSVVGVEPDERARTWARRHCSFEAKREVSEVDGRFDIVLLWHVLEHLEHPRETMTEALDHLAEGGYVVLAVPNRCSLDAQRYGIWWVAWDAPEHLSHFSPASLEQFGATVALEPRGLRPIPGDTLFNCLASEATKAKSDGRGRSFVGAITAAWTAARVYREVAKKGVPAASSLLSFWSKRPQ